MMFSIMIYIYIQKYKKSLQSGLQSEICKLYFVN